MDNSVLAERLDRAKRGDEDALRDLLGQFEGEVRMVVRARLPRALRSQYDSTDFVQAVWESVFTGERLDLKKFETPAQLLAYLAAVARNKVLEEYRRRTTLKYDIERQEPLYVRRGSGDVPREVAGHDPTPSQDAQAGDRLAQILKGCSPLERKVVELRRLELTYKEIAERLRIHERAVRRIIETIRDDLEDLS